MRPDPRAPASRSAVPAWRKLRIALGAAMLAALSACDQYVCTRGNIEMVEHPYPREYANTPRDANRVVGTLRPGRYKVTREVMGKDYLMYEVRTSAGATGFILSEGNVDECR